MLNRAKKSFTLLEVIFIIALLATITSFTLPKLDKKDEKLSLATNRLLFYLKYLRYTSYVDDKYSNEEKWYKKRWTLKFLNCNEDVGGIFYQIYSDSNMKGKANKEESLIDPLTKKYIYSFHDCSKKEDRSEFTLLSKEYDIKDVEISCNKTSTIGQISFGSDGRIYASLSKKEQYEIKKRCKIKLISENSNYSIIELEPKTGFSRIIK